MERPAGCLALVVAFLLWRGTLVVQPKQAVVLLFFGRYIGTCGIRGSSG